jgi:methylated-DNA-[protein]-cysteine S-methyltransferase
MQKISAIARIATPIGCVELRAGDGALTGLRIDPSDTGPSQVPAGHALLETAGRQLEEWFAGKRKGFDLPLVPLTSLRGETLRAGIAAIEYGQTLT